MDKPLNKACDRRFLQKQGSRHTSMLVGTERSPKNGCPVFEERIGELGGGRSPVGWRRRQGLGERGAFIQPDQLTMHNRSLKKAPLSPIAKFDVHFVWVLPWGSTRSRGTGEN